MENETILLHSGKQRAEVGSKRGDCLFFLSLVLALVFFKQIKPNLALA